MKSEEKVSTSLSLQEAKSARARTAIIDATIKSLAENGYTETSLVLVARAAGYTKGALQHHFVSKEDLIAQTLGRLLSRTMRPPPNTPKAKSVEDALMGAWHRHVNTPPYRALIEILNAARTDKALQKRIRDDLIYWGKRMDVQSLEYYEAVSGDDEEVVMLLNMSRSFMRGLLIQEQYGVSQEQTVRYLRKWCELIAPLLRFKSDPTEEHE